MLTKTLHPLLFLLALSLTGCSASDDRRPLHTGANASLQWITDLNSSLYPETGIGKLQFIGAGGFYLSFPQGSVLVDPFYSNPGLFSVASLRSLKPDTEVIDRHLPPLDSVKAILVGHAHFDHALDVPYIAHKLEKSVGIYGSTTLKNSLAASDISQRVINVEPGMSVNGAGGEWYSVSTHLRVFPIKSEHAPHVGPWVFGSGNIDKPMRRLPDSALNWRAGVNISYLLDILDDSNTPVYRVFIQTSSSSPPNGLAPDNVLNEGKSVDMVVLCAANYDKMEQYPEYLLERMRPQKVVLVHWEKFWTPYEPGQASPLPGLNLDKLYQRIHAVLPHAEVSLLQRGAIMTWRLPSS